MASTTGELLVQMSTLSTGTAMDHFTHISFGGQAGPTMYGIDLVPESGVGANDGSITILASGGTSPYEYSIGGAFQSSNSFSGLAADTYTISTRDYSGYTDTLSGVTLPVSGGANVPIITELLVGDISKEGAKDGSITLVVAGGVTPYEYSLNNGAYQSANVFNNLGTGSYAVTVKDSNGDTSRLGGIKVTGGGVGRVGGYGRGWERHKVYVDVKNVKTTDVKTDKKIKINVTL